MTDKMFKAISIYIEMISLLWLLYCFLLIINKMLPGVYIISLKVLTVTQSITIFWIFCQIDLILVDGKFNFSNCIFKDRYHRLMYMVVAVNKYFAWTPLEEEGRYVHVPTLYHYTWWRLIKA